METGMYVSPSAPPELVTMNRHGLDGIQCPLLVSEKTLKRVEQNCIGGGGSYKGGAVPPTDLRGIAQKMQGPENVYMVGPSQRYLASCMCNTSLYIC